MREMKDSGIEWIGKIPEKWSVKRVKHAFYRKNEKAMLDEPVVLSLARRGVRERDISNNEGQIAESYYNYNPVEIDDLLINPMDLYSGANCSISNARGVISPAYINLRYRDGISPRYYDYYFKIQYWLMAFFAHGKGVSYENRWTLGVETLLNYPIVVPSYKEQLYIADFLDDKCTKIDAIIEKQQKVIEKLKEYKVSVITEAVCAEETWTKGHLGYLADFKNGLNYNGAWDNTEIKFLGVGDFKNHFIMNDINMFSTLKCNGEISEELLLENGDIVFVRSNGSKELVGRSILVDNIDYPLTYSGFCIRMRNIRQDIVMNEFLMFYFWSHNFRQKLNSDSRGSNINNLNQELLSKLVVAFPNMEKQKKIVDYLKKRCISVDIAIERKQALIDKLVTYKKNLIYEVVTGKKEV